MIFETLRHVEGKSSGGSGWSFRSSVHLAPCGFNSVAKREAPFSNSEVTQGSCWSITSHFHLTAKEQDRGDFRDLQCCALPSLILLHHHVAINWQIIQTQYFTIPKHCNLVKTPSRQHTVCIRNRGHSSWNDHMPLRHIPCLWTTTLDHQVENNRLARQESLKLKQSTPIVKSAQGITRYSQKRVALTKLCVCVVTFFKK